jgi:hypothetical protein
MRKCLKWHSLFTFRRNTSNVGLETTLKTSKLKLNNLLELGEKGKHDADSVHPYWYWLAAIDIYWISIYYLSRIRTGVKYLAWQNYLFLLLWPDLSLSPSSFSYKSFHHIREYKVLHICIGKIKFRHLDPISHKSLNTPTQPTKGLMRKKGWANLQL